VFCKCSARKNFDSFPFWQILCVLQENFQKLDPFLIFKLILAKVLCVLQNYLAPGNLSNFLPASWQVQNS